MIELLELIHTQWQRDSEDRWTGYNYEAVDIVIKRRFANNETLFQKMQVCEQAILKAQAFEREKHIR